MTNESNASGKLHVFYIMNGFPRLSETMIINEVIGLIRRGYPVTLASLKDLGNQKIMHEYYRNFDLGKHIHYPGNDVPRNWRFVRFIIGSYRLFVSRYIRAREKWPVWVFFFKKRESRTHLIAFVEIIRMICDRNPDVIYCHFGNVGELAIILRRIFPIPIVTYFHGYDFSRLPFEKKSDYRELFNRGDQFFANSTFTQQRLIQIGCPADKIVKMGYPIAVDRFPLIVKKPGPVIHLLGVGRLVEKKGFTYSIDAVSQVVNKYPKIQYTIVGDGPLHHELAMQIEQLGMKDKIILSGFRTQEEIIRFLQESDIFILSSVTASTGDTEGLGIVLLEAQLSGLPVVATRHNGFVDAVADGKSGYLVPEKDADALAERIIYLIRHPEHWQEMGARGREHVLVNFTEDVYMEKLIKRLNELCPRTK